MFEILVPITKAVSSKNKLLVEGVASGPMIDTDYEKFDIEAIKKMKDTVNSGEIPIRIEHEDKFYTEIGIWKTADIDESNQLIIKGEVNTKLSLGNDLKIKILEEKQPVALSVGGRILKFVNEFNAELNKNIRVYKDIILDEISIVKYPAYPNASLSISKSADKKKSVGSVMKKVSCKEFENLVKGKTMIKSDKKLIDWADNVYSKIEKHITKYVNEYCYEEEETNEYVLTVDDLKIIPKIVYILNNADLPEDDFVPEILRYNDDYSNIYYDSISEDCYIILGNRRKLMPHHNPDFSLNKELILYQLKELIDGNGWLTTDGYTIALSHLYQHLKQLDISDKNSQKSETIDSKYLEVIEKSYSFLMNGVGEIPFMDGKQLDYATLKKCAVCYQILNDNNNKLNSDIMKPKNKIKKSDETSAEVVEEKKEEEKDEIVEKEEVKKEEEKVVEKEEVKEENSVDELKKSLETKKEDVKEVIEKSKDVVNEDFTKSMADLKKSMDSLGEQVEEKVMKNVNDSLSSVTGSLDIIAKSIIKSNKESEEVKKGFNDLKENQDKLLEIVNTLADVSVGRKSIATQFSVIDKSEKSKSHEEKVQALIEKGMNFAKAQATVKKEELN